MNKPPVQTAANCAGKQQFPTFELAQEVAKRGNRASGATRTPYRCACGWWHIGGTVNGARRHRAHILTTKKRNKAQETES